MFISHFHRARALASLCFAVNAAVAATAAADALTFSTAIKEGDFVPAVGAVTSIENLAINNSGQWIVEANTDGVSTANTVLIRSGSVLLQEGFVPAGLGTGTLSSFDAVNINNAGVFGGNVFFSGTGSTSNDSGVMQEQTIVVREGAISAAPQFSANTPYIGWFETRINDAGQHLTMSSVDDPAITSTVDRAIVRWDVTPAGALTSETVIAKEGDILPGHDQAVADFLTGPHNFAFNNAGAAMFVVDGAGDTATDFAVYVGSTMVAREGSVSPVGGRNYSNLGSSRIDMNNSGGYVFTGVLAGDTATDNVIIRNGAKLIQEGDTLPAIGGVFTFTSFGTAPVAIDDNNNVLWFGDWNDTDTTRDTGIFLNDQLIVQEGVTTIGGVIVQSLPSIQDAFAISDNGQYIIFEATLADGANGAFIISVPEPTSLTALLGVLPILARRRSRR